MTLQEIKDAIASGKTVYWSNLAYKVVKDKYDQYFIKCTINNDCIGLTLADDTTMNGKEEDFFTPPHESEQSEGAQD